MKARKSLNGTQAARKPKSGGRSFHPFAPVKTLLERYERENPGLMYTWLANQAHWQQLRNMATREEIEQAIELGLEKPHAQREPKAA